MANLASVYKKNKGIEPTASPLDVNAIIQVFLNVIPKVNVFSVNSRIFAKESMNMPMMARDANITRQNIAKIVGQMGMSPTRKADSFFERLGDREKLYESNFSKENKSLKGKEVGAPLKTSALAQKAVDYGMLSLGLAGFFGALAIAGNLINTIPGGLTGMKDMLSALAEGLGAFSLDSFIKFSALLAAGALFGSVAGIGKTIGAGLGIASIGVGIGGFFSGLALGGTVGDMIGNSAGIKEMMINLAEGLSAFSGDTFTQFSALLAVGGVFGAVAGNFGKTGAATAGGAMLGMGLIGLGIGSFFSGLSIGGALGTLMTTNPTMIKDLLVNVAGGLDAVAELDAGSLLKLVPVLPAFGIALVGFLGLQGLGNIIDTLGSGINKVFGFIFGEKNQKSPLEKVADDLSKLQNVNPDVAKVGQGFVDLVQRFKVLGDLSDKQIEQAVKNGNLALKLAESLSKGKASPSTNLPKMPGRSAMAYDERRTDKVDDSLVNYIKNVEGFRAKAYWDIKQYTNGYGTEAKSPDEVITEAEAERRLREKLQETQDYVSAYLQKNGYDFTQGQLDALTSFTYNLGPGGLKQLTNNGTRSLDEIKAKLVEYNKAGGEVLAGLVKRRSQELEMFSGNTTPVTTTPRATASPATSTPTTGTAIATTSSEINQTMVTMNTVPPTVVLNVPEPTEKQTTEQYVTPIASTIDFGLTDAMFGSMDYEYA